MTTPFNDFEKSPSQNCKMAAGVANMDVYTCFDRCREIRQIDFKNNIVHLCIDRSQAMKQQYAHIDSNFTRFCFGL